MEKYGVEKINYRERTNGFGKMSFDLMNTQYFDKRSDDAYFEGKNRTLFLYIYFFEKKVIFYNN